MTSLQFTIKTIELIGLEYELTEENLIIYPNSSMMMELLPGRWVEKEDGGGLMLVCNIKNNELITPLYLAGLLGYLETRY